MTKDSFERISKFIEEDKNGFSIKIRIAERHLGIVTPLLVRFLKNVKIRSEKACSWHQNSKEQIMSTSALWREKNGTVKQSSKVLKTNGVF